MQCKLHQFLVVLGLFVSLLDSLGAPLELLRDLLEDTVACRLAVSLSVVSDTLCTGLACKRNLHLLMAVLCLS